MDKRTPSLRREVLGAGTAGPAVARVGTIQLNWVSSACYPKRDQRFFWRLESTVSRAGMGHQPEAMEGPAAARRAHAQGADGVHSASLATREMETEPAAG